MGTKLEYAINLLATSPNSSSLSVQHCVNDRDNSQTKAFNKSLQIIGLDKLCNSMERMADKKHMDLIRKTMQRHEDIFQHQVRELHRLYNVQRMLMEELQKEIKQNRKYWSSMKSADIEGQTSATQMTGGYNFINVQTLRDEPCSRERSGSCSGENMRITRGFDLETPVAAEEDMISTGISTINDNQAGPSSYMRPDDDNEVELTLSIGGSLSKKVSKDFHSLHSRDLDSPTSFKSERGEECSAPTTPISSSSTTYDQERQRPHWLFQGLSINRT